MRDLVPTSLFFLRLATYRNPAGSLCLHPCWQVVLPLQSIRTIKRVKFAQLFNNAMEVHLASGEEIIYFSGFLHRNDCVACIQQQALKLNHPLVVV